MRRVFGLSTQGVGVENLVIVLNIVGRPTAVPEDLLEEGGVHKNSGGGGSAWQNLLMYFYDQSPSPSGVFPFDIFGGEGGECIPPTPIILRPTRDPLGLLVMLERVDAWFLRSPLAPVETLPCHIICRANHSTEQTCFAKALCGSAVNHNGCYTLFSGGN